MLVDGAVMTCDVCLALCVFSMGAYINKLKRSVILTASYVMHNANLGCTYCMKKRMPDTSDAVIPGSGHSRGMKYQSIVKYQSVAENDYQTVI
jgi:hypothetical protein